MEAVWCEENVLMSENRVCNSRKEGRKSTAAERHNKIKRKDR